MPVTKTEVNVAQEVINVLLGDKGEAQAYSENPEGWLDGHGYADVSAEALATCGVGGGGGGGGAGASASASASAAVAPPISAGATAQLDYIVYNNYYEDNSITNNIENHGDLDFQQVVGDNNVTAGDDIEDSQVQTGEGNVQIDDSVLNDSNVEAGEGDQLVDESVTTATSVEGDAQAGSAGGDVTQAIEEAPPEEAPEAPAEPIL